MSESKREQSELIGDRRKLRNTQLKHFNLSRNANVSKVDKKANENG